MKLLKNTVLLLTMIVLFSGCFEIVEEVDMNSDGSGSAVLTIDMSESKDNLKNYMTMDEFNGVKIPKQTDIEKEIAKLKSVLQNYKGISNVKSQSDFDNFVFKLSGDFIDTKTLNKAINKVVGELNRSPFPAIKKDNFAATTNSFSRLFEYKINPDIYNRLDFGTRFLLETARISGVYRFKKPIRKFTNKDAQLSPSKKAVLFKSNLAPLVKGEKSIKNDITF